MSAHSFRPPPSDSLSPALRFDIAEAAQLLRMSRAQLYARIHAGAIRPQKDGARTYVTRIELERYVASCDPRPAGPNVAEVLPDSPRALKPRRDRERRFTDAPASRRFSLPDRNASR